MPQQKEQVVTTNDIITTGLYTRTHILCSCEEEFHAQRFSVNRATTQWTLLPMCNQTISSGFNYYIISILGTACWNLVLVDNSAIKLSISM